MRMLCSTIGTGNSENHSKTRANKILGEADRRQDGYCVDAFGKYWKLDDEGALVGAMPPGENPDGCDRLHGIALLTVTELILGEPPTPLLAPLPPEPALSLPLLLDVLP